MAFYHCKAGGVWVLEELAGEEVSASVTSSLSATASNSSDTTFSCELCADTVEEGLEVGMSEAKRVQWINQVFFFITRL